MSRLDDQLEAFTRAVNLKLLRPDLNKALIYSNGSKGERSPFDPVLMFKIMVFQTLNNLSDEQNEYLIDDHLSFMRFLGLVECHDMAVSRASETSGYYSIDGFVQLL